MLDEILATKLYMPRSISGNVNRPRLIDRLNARMHRKMALVSASAGFGKTTAVRDWVANCERPVAWLSLDSGDRNIERFLSYVVAAMQTVNPDIGHTILSTLQSQQIPSLETLLTTLINEIASAPEPFVLVLDDYHTIASPQVDEALAFLVESMPQSVHLVVITREDPNLPLPRLRARGEMTELRASDLRFTIAEATEFFNEVNQLNLSPELVTALESRTEGWIVGLHLVALSLQTQDDASSFIASFTGSHRFVLDYLMEEVLHQQPGGVQRFLLRTSILQRMCGPLCDAVLGEQSGTSQKTLEYLERANLFIVPLDNERHWYRYHHLFAELLRQRLNQSAVSPEESRIDISDLHVRASTWFESQRLEIEAFDHATAANDVDRAERLIHGEGRPLYVRGGAAAVSVLNWLESLPTSELDARPSLWVTFATALSIVGQITRVEKKLQAAEAAIRDARPDDHTRDLIGRIANLRALVALLAADPHQLETIIAQSRRALEYLHPDNLFDRAAPIWRLGLAYQLMGDRVEARQAHTEAISVSEASGHVHVNILATTCLGHLQYLDNELNAAIQTYQRVLQLIGEPPGPVACEACAGLARLFYEWNDLDAAEQHATQSVKLARQIEIDSFINSELILARVKIARGDAAGATTLLAQTERDAIARNFLFRLPNIAAVQVRALLREGNLSGAAQLAETHDLPVSLARVHLAREDPSAALAVLEPVRQLMETKNWPDELLGVLVLQAVAHHSNGEADEALRVLRNALEMAKPEGFIRTFVDEGSPMSTLLTEANALGVMPDYTARILAAFASASQAPGGRRSTPSLAGSQLAEPLTQRELEVLRLIAGGLSNGEISERLFLSLNTVKGHNRVIFSKLQVQRRTEAVARARELGIL